MSDRVEFGGCTEENLRFLTNKIAEMAQIILADLGELAPAYFVETKDALRVMFLRFDSREMKARANADAIKAARTMSPVRVVMVLDAFYVTRSDEEVVDVSRPPSEQSDRKEAIHLLAADCNSNFYSCAVPYERAGKAIVFGEMIPFDNSSTSVSGAFDPRKCFVSQVVH